MKAFEIGAKKTIVFFLHGLRGHAYAQQGALQHMVKNLGVTIVSLELPGHGEDSFKQHCMVPSFRVLVEDIKHEIMLRSQQAEQVILMGYSFGGALMSLAAHELEQDDDFKPLVAGFIGISTAFDVAHNVPAWQVSLSASIAPISRFLYKNARPLSGLVTIGEMNVEKISRDLSVQTAISNDELVYKGRIPLNTSAQVHQAGLAAKANLNKVNFPVLLQHSKDDGIALAPEPDTLAKHVKLNLYENLRHNCIDGLSRSVVHSRKAITQFIVEKL